MDHRWTRRVLAGAAALALLAAGCGDDDETADATGAEATDDEAADTGGATADTSGDAADPEFSGSGSGDFCAMARELDENDPFADVDIPDMRAAFEEMFALFDDVIGIAPDEIRGDFETLADGMDQMQALLEEADYDFMAVDEAAMDAIAENAEFNAAADRIDTYMEDVCGIVDDFEDDGLDGDLESPDLSVPEGASDDEAAAAIVAQMLGVTEEQALCLIEESGGLADDADFTEVMQYFDACGVDPMELGQG